MSRLPRYDVANVRITLPGAAGGLLGESDRRQLESLDDAMFAAIDGCRDALADAERLWQQAVESVDRQLLEESREQYLRYAVDVTRRFEATHDGSRDRALLAIEVIALLAWG